MRVSWRTAAVVIGLVAIAATAGQAEAGRSAGGRTAPVSGDPASPATSSAPAPPAAAPTTTASTPATATAQLVAWTGPVEHLFFHTLVIRPGLAFTNDRLAQGFRDYFVTVSEFRRILDELYAHSWTLVDLHRVAAGTVRVPPGRRPVVISEDDVNYYEYERPRGLGWRLALDPTGAVKVEVHDESGVRLTDDDLVPLIDEFVTRHPDFSADGAKGVLALTGYQGLFGERVQDPTSTDYRASVARAVAVATELKATGWMLASHSYGHIDLGKSGTRAARHDTQRWKALAQPIIGPTDIYVYPFGARPPPGSGTVNMLQDEGFEIVCDIDVVPRLTKVGGVVIMSRRHVDGLALRQQAPALASFFDAATVTGPTAKSARPGEPGPGGPRPGSTDQPQSPFGF